MNSIDELDIKIEEKYAYRMQNVHQLECEEVLDNLGYIQLNKNDKYEKPSLDYINDKIKTFRQEYAECYHVFHDSFDLPYDTEGLNEAEIEFMQKITSLEGEFNLHEYSMEEIRNNKLLSRVLTFRLNILNVFNVEIDNKLSNIDQSFELLKIWCNVETPAEVISLLGDIEELSERTALSNINSDSLSHYFAFFKPEKKRLKIPELEVASNWEIFDKTAKTIHSRELQVNRNQKQYIKQLHDIKKNPDKIESYKNEALNNLQLRMIQIRLWLLGAYEGKLDSEMGPITAKAIQNAIYYSNDDEVSKSEERFLRDLVYYIKKANTWVINVNYLFKMLFPEILDKNNPKDQLEHETLTEKIMQVTEKLEEPSDREKVYKIIENQLDNSDEPTKNKVKTRGGRGFLRSIGRFFKKVAKFIKEKLIDEVIKTIKKLFSHIKNAVRVLLREFKKIISMIKTAFTFFFSARTVRTSNNKEEVFTDYDYGFDNCTKVTGYNSQLINEHIDKIKYISDAMSETSDFLGVMLNILIKLISGPYGWMYLALEAIKHLAKTQFKYNRLSFRSFE